MTRPLRRTEEGRARPAPVPTLRGSHGFARAPDVPGPA